MRERQAWAHALAAGAHTGEPARRHARAALATAGEHGFLPVERRAAEKLAERGETGMRERAATLRARRTVEPLPGLPG